MSTLPALPKPEITFHAFKPKILELVVQAAPPSFTTAEEVFTQLRYLEEYVGHSEMGCKSVVIETPYIDRDHMEDHSTFYSRNLLSYPNYCTRVHFFSQDPAIVERGLQLALSQGVEEGLKGYQTASDFLSLSYLGFAVIKPLRGSPVGRTVLRCFPDKPAEPERALQFRRAFTGTRVRKVHLLGVELNVCGLECQQQDAAVSACATTAIWSSLQKMGDHEEISPATPAQITMLASRYSLPFGRAMPSEGLSIDQMCQAIQAMGVSPSVVRAEHYETARGFLYAAANSQVVPILILEQDESYHAVAVAGAKLSVSERPKRDAAEKLIGLYVHDDRTGPYRYAKLAIGEDGATFLEIPEAGKPPDVWRLTHIITPLYHKNRLLLSGLRDAALALRITASRLVAMLFVVPPENSVRAEFATP